MRLTSTWRSRLYGVAMAAFVVLPLATAFQASPPADSQLALLPNNPPTVPTLDGPRSGAAGVPYHYTACASDPDGDALYYTFDWGDGCMCTVACCVASGEPCTACHQWDTWGVYRVRACAADTHHCYGDWSDPLPVAMPKYIHAELAGVSVNSK